MCTQPPCRTGASARLTLSCLLPPRWHQMCRSSLLSSICSSSSSALQALHTGCTQSHLNMLGGVGTAAGKANPVQPVEARRCKSRKPISKHLPLGPLEARVHHTLTPGHTQTQGWSQQEVQKLTRDTTQITSWKHCSPQKMRVKQTHASDSEAV